jgi:hypothetical protein
MAAAFGAQLGLLDEGEGEGEREEEREEKEEEGEGGEGGSAVVATDGGDGPDLADALQLLGGQAQEDSMLQPIPSEAAVSNELLPAASEAGGIGSLAETQQRPAAATSGLDELMQLQLPDALKSPVITLLDGLDKDEVSDGDVADLDGRIPGGDHGATPLL